MANHHQNQAESKSSPSSNAEPKTYTSVPRTWSQESPNSHTRLPSSTDSVNTNYQNQHTTSRHNSNLPTPMDRWLAESLKETPFNAIASFETPPQGQGKRQAAEGGEKMERANGGGERYAEDNWSMDRNEQSERWA